MPEKPVVQIMPATNGFIIQVQRGGPMGPVTESSVANNDAEMLDQVAMAYATVVEPDAGKDTPTVDGTPNGEPVTENPQPAKKKAPAKRGPGKKKAAPKKEEPAAEPEEESLDDLMGETTPEPEPEKVYAADDLRKLMTAAGKKIGGPAVVAIFSPFGYKNVVEVEEKGMDDLPKMCKALEKAINHA